VTVLDLRHATAPHEPPAGGDGPELSDLPAVVVDVGWRAIGPEAFVGLGDVAGHAVLVSTGWDLHWGTARWSDPTHPFLTGAGAAHLVAAGVALVGTDLVDVDDASPAAGGARPTRALLLAAGVPVVEHLTGLDALPETGARVTVVLSSASGPTSPVRAVAVVG
jgi:kynurenine formamidase